MPQQLSRVSVVGVLVFLHLAKVTEHRDGSSRTLERSPCHSKGMPSEGSFNTKCRATAISAAVRNSPEGTGTLITLRTCLLLATTMSPKKYEPTYDA